MGLYRVRKGVEKSCGNVTTDTTFSKATCIIQYAYFCVLARIFSNSYEPDPSRRRKDRAPRAPVDHRSRDAGVREELVEHRELRRRALEHRYGECLADGASARRSAPTTAAGRGSGNRPPREIPGQRAPGASRPVHRTASDRISPLSSRGFLADVAQPFHRRARRPLG